MNSDKGMGPRLIGNGRPFTVADIHVMTGAYHQNVISPLLQNCLQFQGNHQIQLIFAEPCDTSGSSTGYFGLPLRRSGADGF